jgi:hypothetical protein
MRLRLHAGNTSNIPNIEHEPGTQNMEHGTQNVESATQNVEAGTCR